MLILAKHFLKLAKQYLKVEKHTKAKVAKLQLKGAKQLLKLAEHLLKLAKQRKVAKLIKMIKTDTKAKLSRTVAKYGTKKKDEIEQECCSRFEDNVE